MVRRFRNTKWNVVCQASIKLSGFVAKLVELSVSSPFSEGHFLVPISLHKCISHLPVVHEHIWFPQAMRWDPNIFNVPVLGLVPLHIDVGPLLRIKKKTDVN